MNRLAALILAILLLGVIFLSGCTLVVSTQPPAAVAQSEASAELTAASDVPGASPSVEASSLTGTPTEMAPTATPTLAATNTAVPAATYTSTPLPSPTSVPATNTPSATAAPTTAVPATPTPMPSPTLTATLIPPQSTVRPTATPVIDTAGVSAPTIEETTITINTYDYQPALVATDPDDPVYPYPRLAHEKVGPPSPKSYRALVLENKYLELTILPDLGGRIYRWIDKASGKNLFYENPVVKPTIWGHRGWWLATGGMEWALPLDEHGLSEASAWRYTTRQGSDSASVTLSNEEKRSGLVSELTISVDGLHSYFTLTPKISNPTSAPISYKFWINGMFALGAAEAQSGVDFVLPGSTVTVHSTGDPGLPGERETIDWPYFQGRDLSDYSSWKNYLGVFAAPAASDGFMGAYNHLTNLGVARIFPYQQVRGAKVFGPGDLDPKLWTTDGSTYFELWGGLAPTFWDEVTLGAGQSVSWQEWWYAVGDMGGFSYANAAAALNVGVTGDTVQVAAASSYAINGQLVLWNGEDPEEVKRWPVWVSPTRPFRGSVTPPSDMVGPWGLSLHDETGRAVASVGPTGSLAAASTTPVDASPTPPCVGCEADPSPPEDDDVLILDIDGQQRDWDWVQQEFGYELQRAPTLSADGKVFRLIELQEVEGSSLFVIQARNERNQGLSRYYAAFSWPDAPKDIKSFDNQDWHGLTRAAYGYPDALGNWGMGLGSESKQPPGAGECAAFMLSSEIPSDVLSRVGPLDGTDYRMLRPTFKLIVEGGTSSSTSGGSESSEDEVIWDPRLDELGITLKSASPQSGKPYYQLIAARFRDEGESEWLHHIYVEVVDEGGRRIIGQNVVMAWDDGKAMLVTEDKDPPEYAANAPMYGELGDYRVYVDGGVSDVVDGMGLPGKHHVSFLLTFQRVQ
jgi:hypothetical protein